MKTALQPFGERVLVAPSEAPQQTASGIYIAESARERPAEGRIVAIGEGATLHERLCVGDRILFQKFSGTEVTLESATYVLLGESDILGRLIEVDQIPQREPDAASTAAR